MEKKPNKFVQLTGIGLQIGVTIYLASLLGKMLDEKYNTRKPYFTLSIIFVVFVLNMFLLVKKLNKLNEDN